MLRGEHAIPVFPGGKYYAPVPTLHPVRDWGAHDGCEAVVLGMANEHDKTKERMMRIETSCNPAKTSVQTLLDIPVGTVFRFGAHEFGPYLRTSEGYLNLHTAEHRISQASLRVTLLGYRALPRARLVTGEDE